MSLELVRSLDTPAVEMVAEAIHRIANHLAMIAGLMRSQGARIFERQQTMTGREVRLTNRNSLGAPGDGGQRSPHVVSERRQRPGGSRRPSKEHRRADVVELIARG